MEQPRLHSGIGFNFYRLIVLPRDVKTAGHPHDVGSAVAFALLAGSFIFRGIPCICDLLPGRVERDSGVVTLRRREHSPSPIFGNNRYPISARVEWSHLFWTF